MGIFLFLTSYLLLIGVVGFSITYRFVAKFEESEHMLNTVSCFSCFNHVPDSDLRGQRPLALYLQCAER